MYPAISPLLFFLFNAPATTDIYTLSLHDALPIYFHSRITRLRFERSAPVRVWNHSRTSHRVEGGARRRADNQDRKSTRLNSSHSSISYAVFCLKKKNKKYKHTGIMKR